MHEGQHRCRCEKNEAVLVPIYDEGSQWIVQLVYIPESTGYLNFLLTCKCSGNDAIM